MKRHSQPCHTTFTPEVDEERGERNKSALFLLSPIPYTPIKKAEVEQSGTQKTEIKDKSVRATSPGNHFL